MIQEDEKLSSSDYKIIRQFAVQFVYQQELNQQILFHKPTFDSFVIQSNVPSRSVFFLYSLLSHLFDNLQIIDSTIEKFVKNWKIHRIAKVELSIMRVACTEILHRTGTDAVIITSEATTLAQEFGSANSPAFINGVLDAISKEVRKKF